MTETYSVFSIDTCVIETTRVKYIRLIDTFVIEPTRVKHGTMFDQEVMTIINNSMIITEYIITVLCAIG